MVHRRHGPGRIFPSGPSLCSQIGPTTQLCHTGRRRPDDHPQPHPRSTDKPDSTSPDQRRPPPGPINQPTDRLVYSVYAAQLGGHTPVLPTSSTSTNIRFFFLFGRPLLHRSISARPASVALLEPSQHPRPHLPLSETNHIARNNLPDKKGSRVWGAKYWALSPPGFNGHSVSSLARCPTTDANLLQSETFLFMLFSSSSDLNAFSRAAHVCRNSADQSQA